MKYWLALCLLLAVACYAYWRLRPYIKMARRALAVLRDVRQLNATARPAGQPARKSKATAAPEPLVRCTLCGTWSPASRAVTLRPSKTSYCSHACLERAAKSRHAANRSAS